MTGQSDELRASVASGLEVVPGSTLHYNNILENVHLYGVM